MADIITRLLLKTNDFDANLNKAKGSVNQFQGGIANMAKTAGAGIMKFAGTIGIAVGSAETFGKIMGSQQSTQDEWNNNIYAAKLSVEKFFTSINNGDWTSFHNGFAQSFIDAKNLSAEIDALNDKRLSLTYIKSEALAKIEENRAIATDTTESKETRRSAFAAMQNERKALAEKTNETIKKETDVLIKELNVKYGNLGWSEGDVIEFVIDTNFTGGSAEFQAYKEQLTKLKSEETKTMYHAGGVTGGMSSSITDEAAVERTRQFKIQNQHLEKQRILEQEIDESRIKTVNLLRQQAAERRELSLLEKSENRIKKQLNGGAGNNKPAPPSVGSLAALDAEITRQNKKLAEATTMQARAAVQATINKLEQQKINLKVVVDQEAFKIKHGEMKGGSLGAPGSIYEALQNNAGNKKQGSFDLRKELPNMKLPKFKSPIKKADINLNEEYAASLNSIGSIMGSLSGTFDGGAASVLQWGASIFSTIAQVIPLLNALTEANEIETKSEVKGAVGKTMNAHAKIPFVGIAMGLAGVASIFSVMSQASKFATGGIVPGNSFTGDKVPAWVNSGEMILNSEQQSNLFKMLNGKLYGGLNIGRPNIEPQTGNIAALIAPDDNGRDIRVSGDIKVKGSDLYLSLDNYKKKTGKK